MSIKADEFDTPVKRDVYSLIFRKIDRLTGGIEKFMNGEGYLKLKSKGFMDLVIEKIDNDVISIVHYYESMGDLVPDPDVTVRIDLQNKVAEALTYQDSLTYQIVYPEANKVILKYKKSLNTFLCQWLRVLAKQGFYK